MKTTLLLCVVYAAMTVTASLTCGSDTCADDEVCNITTPACQCNTTLYTYTGPNPSPDFTCDGGKFNILMSKCWLEANRFNTTNMRLQSATCVAQRELVNGVAQMGIHRPLATKDCGTTATSNGTHVTYMNQLHIFSRTVPVIAQINVVMAISCTYPLTMNNVALHFSLHPISGSTQMITPATNANFTVNMVAYRDQDFTVPLSAETILYVQDIIYISVSMPDLDATTFSVQVLRIYATGEGSNVTEYNLLVNGCPATGMTAGLISVMNNGNGNEARFQMKVFQIIGFIYVRISAEVVICTNNCVLVCPSQGRLAKSQGGGTTVSIIVEPSERIQETSSASSFSMPQTLPALLFSWILVKLM